MNPGGSVKDCLGQELLQDAPETGKLRKKAARLLKRRPAIPDRIGIIRISVGLEDVHDLIEDLAQALA